MATSNREAQDKSYRFWKSKPVIKYGTKPVTSNKILDAKTVRTKYGTDVETTLIDGYRWMTIDVASDEFENSGVIEFINNNISNQYVTHVTADRIRWEVNGSGTFICAVHNDTIAGCVCICCKTLQINDSTQNVCESSYLYVSPDLRGTGLVKVIINEAIRRAVNTGCDVGSFCTDRIIPSPVATIRYYTRPLNYKYLKANDFVSVGEVDDDVAHDRIKIKLRPPKSVKIAENTDENVQLVHDLYVESMKSFNLHHVLSLEEIRHYFFDDRFVQTILYEDENGDVVDFLTYRYYDIVNTGRPSNPDDKYGNIIRATAIFAYSSNFFRSDILVINAFKVISLARHHLVYIPDTMSSNEIILSEVKVSDEDTLDEEEHALFDQHIMKSRKKQFINLFNWSCPLMTQEMVSYLLFN